MEKVKFHFDRKFIFWIVIGVIGLAAILTGSIIMGQTGNKLMWLPTVLGIILLGFGLTMVVYYAVIEHKRKIIRSKGI